MIRANLLPHSKEIVRCFGLEIDAAHLRQALAGVAAVASVAAIGVGLGEFRTHRLERAAVAREAALVARAPERALSKRLALDVARYQEFAREADAFRRSGTVAALAVARIGNTVPPAVWLDSLDRDADGYTLAGGTQSVELVSGTMFSLGNALPGSRASLLSIDNHATDGVRFRAQLTPGAVVAPGVAP